MPKPRICAAAAMLLLATAGQASAATVLQLLGGRFQVTAHWQTRNGASGPAEAIPVSSETGLFWFFTPGNIELVVKVVDACTPPFDRYWFFASGLTDTEVTLTVADTWSGHTETYHHAGGTLFAPLADTGAFDTCGFTAPACGHGSLADIQASPRPDSTAENLALMIGDGVAAEGALYQRLSADLAAIRAAEPTLADADFYNIWWDPHDLLVGLTPEAHAALKAGAYHEWDCLNTWFGATLEHVFEYSPLAHLRFASLLHAYRVGPDYVALPGVTFAEPNVYGYPAAGPLPNAGMCARLDGAAVDYFFDAGLSRYFRVPSAGAAPVAMGTWTGQGTQPAWWQIRLDCYSRLEASAARPF